MLVGSRYFSLWPQETGYYDQYEELYYHATLILPPLLDSDIPEDDLIFAYIFLGNAYLSTNELLMAANFFLKAYNLDGSLESLSNAAYIFFLAGDHACTYHYYSIILSSDFQAEIPESSIQEILDHIYDLYDGEVPMCGK